MNDCIFCKIAKNEVPSFKVWEDENFLAFLSIFPEIEGMTIIIPKKHYDSYVFNNESKLVSELFEVSKKVAKLLDTKLDGVMRTALVFEGLEVPHLHAKLYPMFSNKKQIPSADAKKASEEELRKVLDTITK